MIRYKGIIPPACFPHLKETKSKSEEFGIKNKKNLNIVLDIY